MGRRTKPRCGRKKTITPGPQAPPGAWTPAELRAALQRPSLARKLELLREVGILDARGRIARMYRSWGRRVSRTMPLD